MHKVWIHLCGGFVKTFSTGSSYWTRLGTTVMAEDAFLHVDLRTEYKPVDSVQKQMNIKWCSYSHVSSVRIVPGGLQNLGLIPEGTELYIFAMTSRWLQGRSIFIIGGYRGYFHTGKEIGAWSWPLTRILRPSMLSTIDLFSHGFKKRTVSKQGTAPDIQTFLLTSALDGGKWPTLCPGCFTSHKQTRHPLNRRIGGLQCRSGRSWIKKSILPLPAFEPQTVQPVRSHCTLYAIQPHVHTII